METRRSENYLRHGINGIQRMGVGIGKREETRMTWGFLAYVHAGWHTIRKNIAPFCVWGHWESDKLNDPPKVVHSVKDKAKLVFRFQDGCPFNYTTPLPVFRLLWALGSWEMKCLGCLSVSASGGRWFQEWFILGPSQYLFFYQTKPLPPGVCSTEISIADLSVFGKGTAELVLAFLYSDFGGWWQMQKCEGRENLFPKMDNWFVLRPKGCTFSFLSFFFCFFSLP